MASNVLWYVALAMVLAVLVEGSVEYIFGTAFDKIPALGKWKWALMYLALGVGVWLMFYYKVDLVALLINLAGGEFNPTPVGFVFSGIVIGRGANYTNDFISRWLVKKPDPAADPGRSDEAAGSGGNDSAAAPLQGKEK